MRERPKDFTTTSVLKNADRTPRKLGKTFSKEMGHGKNVKYVQWIIRSQVLSLFQDMDAVHRLNGSGEKFYSFISSSLNCSYESRSLVTLHGGSC